MKNVKFSRRSFLKAGAAASVASLVAANAAVASAAEPKAAAQENGLFDGMFGGKTPKYIFLFIGDGMGVAQIQSASFYKGTVENNGAVTPAELSFMKFPFVGSVTTYDSTSFCPDSASTATSIASGEKTESGVINMTPWTRDVPFETIAEKLHSQKGYKVGILSTVNIDHATPAAFYAHQASRKNYYEIGEELANSGFEYFAGGDFQDPRGGAVSNYDMAIAKGYKLVTTQAGAAALKAGDKALVIAEQRADAAAMNYSLDAAAGEWQLSDYVRKGIEVLDNPNGFFMMAESGKIDWACHAKAVDFYNQHPNDTLILVTADHETGGMTIGFTTTNYDTYLTNLTKQTMSFIKFDSIIDTLRAQGASFEAAMAEAKKAFGLITANDADAANLRARGPAHCLRAQHDRRRRRPGRHDPARLRAVRHLSALLGRAVPCAEPQVRHGPHHLEPHRRPRQPVRHRRRQRPVHRRLRQHRDLPQAG